MFGIFKKQAPQTHLRVLNKDEMFAADLAEFSSAFSPVMNALDPAGTEEIFLRAHNNYLKRDPNEAHFTPSDFYFDAYTGALFELTDKSMIGPHDSLRMFTLTDSFLRGHGKYQTALALSLMDSWQSRLVRLGAIEL